MTTDLQTLLRLHRSMFIAREIDRVEVSLIKQGLAHFHVSGAGHETTALLADCLGPQDWLHLHYRDKALLFARGLPISEFFSSLLATGLSHSSGRQMSAHFSARGLNIASMVGPVGNNALHSVGNAQAVRAGDGQPVVVCSVGDGTTQQGEFLEAVAEAVRTAAPVLFLVENNRWAISTSTPGQTFFDLPDGPGRELMGVPIRRVDGTNVVQTKTAFEEAVAFIRTERRPALMVLDLERLTNHTNADDQELYRSPDDIAASLSRDPLVAVRNALRQVIGEDGLAAAETRLIEEVREGADLALNEEAPVGAGEAKAPYPAAIQTRHEHRGDPSAAKLTMREALNQVLARRLADDPRVSLLGQDIEDPKGDVFGVTKGLSTAFPGRVRNGPLSESTIVGASIGRALAGDRPVAFLQFADFLPLAFNQILSEMGSMYWRTNGDWQAPVIVMVSCGGYKPGLGPFHAQSLEALMAHTPGIDVMMPSSAADAAGLLNAAFDSGRPTVFLYPKSALNLSDRKTSSDVEAQFVPPGRARTLIAGSDLTLVTYGNPVAQSLLVAERLEKEGATVDLIDLRSISPWDEDAVLRSVRRTGRLLVIHEDNKTAGFGAEVVATVVEEAGIPVKAARVTRADTHIPFHFDAQIATLPSYRRILEAAAKLLEFDVEWLLPAAATGPKAVNAIGSGPADDEVEVSELLVAKGDRIVKGQLVAVVEATKAAVEVESTISGLVVEVVPSLGDKISVGSPLILVEADAEDGPQRASTSERIDEVRLQRRAHLQTPAVVTAPTVIAGVAGIASQLGGRTVLNTDIEGRWDGRTADDIVRLTGIESRRWVAEGETVLSLAVSAGHKLLASKGLEIGDVDLVIAATGTPDRVTPSLACRVADALATGGKVRIPAFDVNAACSGYLYAMTNAIDHVRANPASRVLVITSEVLSPLLDHDDFNTAVLFGDAATATLVSAADQDAPPLFTLTRPIVSGAPEAGQLLHVPLSGDGTLRMNGREVFADAVRAMTQTLTEACRREGMDLGDIDLLVPHQANQRIIEAIERRAGRPAHSVIKAMGNTSSSTIPIALADALPGRKSGDRLGLAAFGGGITYAAAIATVS